MSHDYDDEDEVDHQAAQADYRAWLFFESLIGEDSRLQGYMRAWSSASSAMMAVHRRDVLKEFKRIAAEIEQHTAQDT